MNTNNIVEKIDIEITKMWVKSGNSIKAKILTKTHHLMKTLGAKGLYSETELA